ncbi:alpha/beta fold hydrolase [Iamia sp. SCSIO 61187]|uniref:alpha/beta fold hydrolase n=1 Tax=Iamia sp. SCSIO 61187 TaxID=2722752 RepID=UPI001C630897|nr:alpha/beta fold hydrolase [Iamia sp. SCSIO 61187]QYG91624.1 alpha/beta fold hydrolase [Iamia sp. SCSIO 61187]
MAYVRTDDGVRLHYQVWGPSDGEPLLLVHGLGADHRAWIMQRRSFGARYRCIAFDNRGVGSSDKPEGPYDLEVMARDALLVLDAAGHDSAHVVGVSMGGILAQIIGVRAPERVRSLTLACTACRHLPWRRELLAEWIEVAESEGMGVFVRDNIRWLMGPRSLRRIWPLATFLAPLVVNVPPHGFAAQARAILAMDDAVADELSAITAPTLVTVGSQDILTPRGDSLELAERIPGAELVIIRGGAHMVQAEHAGTFNRVVHEHLDQVAARPTSASESRTA